MARLSPRPCPSPLATSSSQSPARRSRLRLLSLLLPLLCMLLLWPHLYTPLLLSTPPLLLPLSTLLQLLPSMVPDTLGKQWQPPGKSHDPYQVSLKRKSNLPSFTTKNSTNHIHCPFN